MHWGIPIVIRSIRKIKKLFIAPIFKKHG